MSTAEQTEATTPDVPDVPPMPAAVQFASRGRYLTVERVRPRRVVAGNGEVFWTEPVHYEFQDGFLLVFPGQDKLPDKWDPATNETTEQDAIEYLRGHELYNTDRGFWEVAPLTPDPAPTMLAVMQLAVALGNPEKRAVAEERLVALYEEEAGTWKRPVVLDACKVALAAAESQTKLTEPEAPAPPVQLAEPPPGPAIAHRDEDGVLHVDEGAIPAGFGQKDHKLHVGGEFNPDKAPPKKEE